MVSENVKNIIIDDAIYIVLILVLVEDGLGGCIIHDRSNRAVCVLILVLVEDGLGVL